MMFIEKGSKSNERMLSYLPPFYETSRVMKAILKAQGGEIDQSIIAFDSILDQLFIETATWALKDYEKQLGCQSMKI